MRDSGGLTSIDLRGRRPAQGDAHAGHRPAGLQLTLDGQPMASPFSAQASWASWRTLGVVSPQTGEQPRTSSSLVGRRTRRTPSSPRRRHHVHRDLHPQHRARGVGLLGLLRQPRLHRHLVTRLDPTVDFDWGTGRPSPASPPTPSACAGRARCEPKVIGDVHVLHAQRRRRAAVGQRPADRQQLDRPRRDREQRHHRAHRRPALRHPDGVLRERRAGRGAPQLVRARAWPRK